MSCKIDGNAGVWDRGNVIAVSAGCECMGDTCGSGVVSSAYDELDMSMVRGLKGVDVGGVWDMCLCLGCGGVGAVGGMGGWPVSGSGRVVGVMSVCVMSPDSLCRLQLQLSVYCARRIPAHLQCTQCLIL